MGNGPPKENRNLRHLFLSIIEAALTIGTGIYFYVVKGKEEIGFILGLMGVYLILNRVIAHFMIEEIFKETEVKISQIQKITDIRNESNVELFSEALDVYLKITEPEFAAVKSKVVNDAIDKLNKLHNEKRSEELDTADYYHWLLPNLERVEDGGVIKAISCMFSVEWDNSPEEERFMKGNLGAAKKGCTVERIFIMRRELLNEALELEAVMKHTKEQRRSTKLNGYFVDKGKIDPSFMKIIGHGFIIFNSRFALIDKFDHEGKVRGIVTMNEHEIGRMEEAFDKLKNISQDLSISLRTESDGSNRAK